MEKSSRKKILYVVTKSNWGGAQRYVYDLATTCAESHDVVVAFGGEGYLSEKLTTAGIKTIQIPALGRDINIAKEWKVFFALLSIIKDERPDVLHVNSSKAGGVGALAGRIARVPRIIFTAHGWEFNNSARTLFAKICIRILSRLTITLAHTTIAVSESVRKTAPYTSKNPKKLTTVKNGIRAFTPKTRTQARSDLRDRYPALGNHNDAFWIGIVAELHPIKGIDVAIDAMTTFTEKYPGSVLVVCGEGDARLALSQKIARNGLSDSVFLLGHVPGAEQLISAFDIFLLPSRSEGLGYVLLEAGIAGAPVVASDVGGIPEIITNEQTGLLFPNENTAALAQALETVYKHPEMATSYGNALRDVVTSTFTLEKMAADTAAIYWN